jgi:hypothetical protein
LLLKFEDVEVAVASFTVVSILLQFTLNIVLIPTFTHEGADIAELSSYLISALIVGLVFAGKIREGSKMASVGKIIVMNATVILFVFMISRAANGHWNAVTDDTLRTIYSTSSWTNNDWYTYEGMSLVADSALTVLYVLLLGFTGLILGSLRKPSAKN